MRRLRSLAQLTLLITGAAVAQAQPQRDSTRLVPVLVLDGSGNPRSAVSPQDLVAVERGLAKPVLGIKGALSWSTTVWVSLPASDPASLETSAHLLAERTAALAALGPVEVVLSDGTSVEPLGGPTRDPGELRRILSELELETGGAGELLELRAAFREELADTKQPADRERLALDILREEVQVVDDERTMLLAWLADAALSAPAEGGRLLILLADTSLETEPGRYAKAGGDRRGPLRELAAEVSRDSELGPLLAAAGWTTVPLLAAGVEPPAATALAELARATGGGIADGPAALDEILELLSRRLGVLVSIPADGDGRPYPFTVRSVGGNGEITAPEWATSVLPEAQSAARARRLLLDDESDGSLRLTAALRLEEPTAGSRRDEEPASLETLVELGRGRSDLDSSALRTTVILEHFDGRPSILHRLGSGRVLGEAQRLLLRATLPLPEDVDRVGVVVEDLSTGNWGGAIAELSDGPLRSTGGALVAENLDLRFGDARGPNEASQDRSTLLRLLPPRERPATGRQRFQVLVTNSAVQVVDFYLDGEKRESDTRPPFSATLDLGAEVVSHTVRVVALDRSGLTLASDELRINADDGSLRVTLLDVRTTRETVDLEAEVTVPSGGTLERVELYYNDGLATLLTGPPYRAHISRTAPGGGDYITVVAHLADGSRAEDVRLLDVPGAVERVDVNLVELYVVATDQEGKPIRDLTAGDFRVSLDGRAQTIERFAAAAEVPLVLGLMVDSSMSMDTIMPATKMAAIRFLGDILSEIDRSFVVDFADRPQLVQSTTGELFTLVSSVSALEPSGSNTALYDAIVFSLLQFGNEAGRRALVLLSDGDDINSRFGYRRVYQSAAAAGLPIYILGIAGLDPDRPSFRKADLEAIAAASGGRVFYIADQSELVAAYDTIAAELRSQYLVTFTTERELTDKEVAGIRVEVPGRPVETRTVIGDR